MSQDLRRQAHKNSARALPSRLIPLQASMSVASMSPPDDLSDEELPAVSKLPGQSDKAKSSIPFSSSRSKTLHSMASTFSSTREKSKSPQSLMPSASQIRDASKAVHSKTSKSMAPPVEIKAPQSSILSSSNIRDPSKATKSIALPAESKVPSSILPSVRDKTKTAQSTMPIPSNFRDKTKASQSETAQGTAPNALPKSVAPSEPPRSVAKNAEGLLTKEQMADVMAVRSTLKAGLSILRTPEDYEMAKRQSKIASLTPREQTKQTRWVQKQLKLTGACIDHYPWLINEEHGGYLCVGGRHFVSDELIVEGKGGWFSLHVPGDLSKGMHGHYYGNPIFPSKAFRAKDGREFQVPRKERDGPIPDAGTSDLIPAEEVEED